MIQFNKTQYLFGAADPGQFPKDTGAEIAFAGRSNAGKSSVINAICRHKNLARSSKTPGATRLIHFFETQENLRLVDLPGYGFARVSKKEQEHWRQLLSHYLEHRRCLRGLVIAMDIRHPLNELDETLIEWCDVRVLLLLTKRDKVSKNVAAATQKKVREAAPGVDEVLTFSKYDSAEPVRKIMAQWWGDYT